MTRSQEVLRHIGTAARGIEIAPWFNPIVAPGGEHEVIVLDVVNRHQELDSFDMENWTVALNRLAARVCAASFEQS
jgi:hypothetical protein